ncbi:MAG: glycolate oxidase subunit GlcE [Methyloceanibacter sp.]|uniref:glycolate oxidase subunit GlcE n=1 Tax=Methyloceanibacter sp. TaxID=1965321 RepID=UPI003D9BA777
MNVHIRLGFHAPQSEEEMASLVAAAAATNTPIEVRGRGSKMEVGRPVQAAAIVSTEALFGVSLYEPAELVLTAWAGTPIVEIERLLDEYGQEFAFEPIDLGPALGSDPGQTSIGAMVATNLSGSRRALAGAARDNVLGVKAVNGRGEMFKAGGRVMKNVTGYDLGRALAGSWGTLAIMTEVTLKVLPAREEVRTLLCFGLPDQTAIEALRVAVGTPFEVSGAAHLQKELAARLSDRAIASAGNSVTAIRVENFSSSVRYRTARLKDMLAAYNPDVELDRARSRAFWTELRGLKMFCGSPERPLWRIATRPSVVAKLISTIARTLETRAYYDWAGGLVWLETGPILDAGAIEIRRNLAEFGGHATLIRADATARASIDVFQPLDAPLMALSAKLKAAFDPAGILNPGRMYPES